MEINLTRKSFVIIGLHESGKTVLAKHICKKFNSIIFDPTAEFNPDVFNVYRPKYKEYPMIAREFEKFIEEAKGKFNLIYISEASRVFPNKRPLLPNARNFFDAYRHLPYSCSIGMDCRRPAQLHTDLIETSKFIFVFHMMGVRDLQYLNFINEDIEKLPKQLEKFHFISIDQDRNFCIMKPVELTE